MKKKKKWGGGQGDRKGQSREFPTSHKPLASTNAFKGSFDTGSCCSGYTLDVERQALSPLRTRIKLR